VRFIIPVAFTVLHTQISGCAVSSVKECNPVLKLLLTCLRPCFHFNSSMQ
jgi:hypothetical protein